MKKVIALFVFAISITSLVFSDEIDRVRELLMAERGGDIEFLSKINIGFPGGDNWVAIRRNGEAFFYTVSGNKVENVHTVGLPSLSELYSYISKGIGHVDLEYDIMKYIPGTWLGDRAAKFGDFNGDGRDEVIDIAMNFNGLNCFMWGYDREKGEVSFYFGADFTMTGSREPAPIGFYNYNGIDGIKTHFWDEFKKNFFWSFSAWDEEVRKYVELVKVWKDESEYTMFFLTQDMENWDWVYKATYEPVNEKETDAVIMAIEQQEEIAIITEADESVQFDIRIAIIAGVVVFAGIIIFILTRKKKS